MTDIPSGLVACFSGDKAARIGYDAPTAAGAAGWLGEKNIKEKTVENEKYLTHVLGIMRVDDARLIEPVPGEVERIRREIDRHLNVPDALAWSAEREGDCWLIRLWWRDVEDAHVTLEAMKQWLWTACRSIMEDDAFDGIRDAVMIVRDGRYRPTLFTLPQSGELTEVDE